MSGALVTLAWMTAGGTAVGLALMLLKRLMKHKIPSTAYYYAYLLVLLRLVLPLPGLIPAGQPAGRQPDAESAAMAAADGPVTRPYRAGSIDAGPYAGEAVEQTDDGAIEVMPAGDAPTAQVQTAPEKIALPDVRELPDKPGFWLGLWALGAVGSMAWHVIGYGRFHRTMRRLLIPPERTEVNIMRELAPSGRPALARCLLADTPMLMGFFRPVLVLPDRDYTPQELRGVLAHELTHYRRGDIAYKWIAALVFCLHWFNPFMGLFRRELSRVCELSCDERLLRNMDAGQMRQYGNTLLSQAESRALPGCVIATTFATEKRCLKERLEQIMKYNNRGKRWLLPALVGMLAIIACGMAVGPASQGSAENPAAPAAASGETLAAGAPVDMENAVRVETVDEFLAAIAPDTTIYLEPGMYDLSSAADYGQEGGSQWYTWEEAADGPELIIYGVENLAIVGAARGQTTVSAAPRYADVVTFRNCANITLSNLTAGHTEAPGECSGGVVYLENTSSVAVDTCTLYGCGIMGITARNCRSVLARDTIIYDCSSGAVEATSSYDVRLQGCSVYECQGTLFTARSCEGFALIDSTVFDNSGGFLRADCREVYILGTAVRDNSFYTMFDMANYSPVVEGCKFENNSGEVYAAGDMLSEPSRKAVSMVGQELSEADLAAMELRSVAYTGPKALEAVKLNKTVNADGVTEVHVSTVDEFLAAIDSNTIIYLGKGEFNLSRASNYCGFGSEHYYWKPLLEGASGLVISGVENLKIVGERASVTTISTEPRYANVMGFTDCKGVEVSDLTVGHTEEPGTCSGGVLYFELTDNVAVKNCRLYGCGILGVETDNCREVAVSATEIFDCSVGAARIRRSTDVSFTDCSIHDCGNEPLMSVHDSENVAFDGCTVENCGTAQFMINESKNVTRDGKAL